MAGPFTSYENDPIQREYARAGINSAQRELFDLNKLGTVQKEAVDDEREESGEDKRQLKLPNCLPVQV